MNLYIAKQYDKFKVKKMLLIIELPHTMGKNSLSHYKLAWVYGLILQKKTNKLIVWVVVVI